MAERLAALNIDITSTVPIGKQVIPIPLLDKKRCESFIRKR
ncbi:hypothetical protein ACT7DD_06060 [Bacillus paranthracis]